MESCTEKRPLMEIKYQVRCNSMIEKLLPCEEQVSASGSSSQHQGEAPPTRTIFLLSPANSSGVRAKILFSPNAQSDLAQRLRQCRVPLGEVYSFISGLYFRGKLTYAERFKNPPPGVAGVYVITAAAGLQSPELMVTLPELQKLSASRVDHSNPDYRIPLDRDALSLRAILEPDTRVVLLGSIATPKYILPLSEIFGERLHFPKDFLGRGDMSRGSLLLRCCSHGAPLEYAPVSSAMGQERRPTARSPRRSSKR